jgi:hypothetical protein
MTYFVCADLSVCAYLPVYFLTYQSVLTYCISLCDRPDVKNLKANWHDGAAHQAELAGLADAGLAAEGLLCPVKVLQQCGHVHE